MLVGSLNGGGRGYYALNVTNPTDGITVSAHVYSGERGRVYCFGNSLTADDTDMGYSHNLPPVNPFTGQAKQIVKMENGQWAVVVGNGYNSNNGKAVLYVLFITGGEDGTWTIGTDYIKLVANAGPANGLSTPVPFDTDGNGLADVIYAGDIKGNLWKFDVSAATPASWNVAIGGLPLFAAGANKPIISPPVISFHPDGGLIGYVRYRQIS